MCGAVNREKAGNDDQNLIASSPLSTKNSIAFILDDVDHTSKCSATSAQLEAPEDRTESQRKRSSVAGSTISSLLAPVTEEKETPDSIRTATRKGSKYCMIEGCVSRAKHARRCWKHGGSVKCKMAGCRNRAKTKGVCWSHGGGTICRAHQCSTIAVSSGVCWAHGGGKRCVRLGCSRPAYERTRNMCSMHYNTGSVADDLASKKVVHV